LRISLDVKATVKVGPFARGGTNRVPTVGADHDFGAVAQVAPIGILVPQTAEVFLYTTLVLQREMVERFLLPFRVVSTAERSCVGYE